MPRDPLFPPALFETQPAAPGVYLRQYGRPRVPVKIIEHHFAPVEIEPKTGPHKGKKITVKGDLTHLTVELLEPARDRFNVMHEPGERVMVPLDEIHVSV